MQVQFLKKKCLEKCTCNLGSEKNIHELCCFSLQKKKTESIGGNTKQGCMRNSVKVHLLPKEGVQQEDWWYSKRPLPPSAGGIWMSQICCLLYLRPCRAHCQVTRNAILKSGKEIPRVSEEKSHLLLRGGDGSPDPFMLWSVNMGLLFFSSRLRAQKDVFMPYPKSTGWRDIPCAKNK